MEKKHPGKITEIIELQVSSRDLHTLSSPVIREEEVNVDVKLIQPVTSIVDFNTPSNSDHPVVLQSDGQFYCIDGWYEIENALSEGSPVIRCRVKRCNGFINPTELAILKVSSRMMPELGRVSYAEQLLGVRQLHDLLMAEYDNLIKYSHGGRRSPEASSCNSVDNVVTVLKRSLGKGRSTIQNYLNYSDSLTIDCLQELAIKQTKQAFFDSAQKNKRALIDDLAVDKIIGEAANHRISGEMIQWHEEFARTGKISPYERPNDVQASDDDSEVAESDQEREHESSVNGYEECDDGSADEMPPREILNFFTPQPITNEPPVPEFTDIKTEYIQFLENAILDSRVLDSPVHVKEHMATVIREILRLQSMIDSERVGDHARSSDVEVA